MNDILLYNYFFLAEMEDIHTNRYAIHFFLQKRSIGRKKYVLLQNDSLHIFSDSTYKKKILILEILIKIGAHY